MNTPTDPDELPRCIRTLYWLLVRLYRSRVEGHDPGPQERAVARYDGGTDRYGKRFPPLWPRLAARYLAASEDPQAALEAVFDSWTGPQPPRPDQVLRSPVRPTDRPDDTLLRLECEQSLARVTLDELALVLADPGERYRQVLLDQTLDLSPLFRYCLASQAGLPEVAARWWGPALWQYLQRPDAYDAVLGEAIPAPLRQEGRRQRDELLREQEALRRPDPQRGRRRGPPHGPQRGAPRGLH